MTGPRIEFTAPFERLADGEHPVHQTSPLQPSPVDWFHNPRYIVYRAAPGFTYHREGAWEERSGISACTIPGGLAGATARPTGRYETRDDGCWAEVYEVAW